MESNNDIENDVGDESSSSSRYGCITVDSVQRALTTFHLPLRPAFTEKLSHHSRSHPPNTTANKYPSISILVCADFDLKSTAALAEYSLQQKNEIFDAKSIDLIVAAGPSHCNTEISKYYQGNNRLKFMKSLNTFHCNRYRNCLSERHGEPSYTEDNGRRRAPGISSTEPFFRSKEESAALEGLITASLSQLESIVCRVVYCPGWNDPISLLQQKPNNKRLTSHSQNIHQQYLPLAPGLGCAGLFYLDHAKNLMDHYQRNQSEMSDIQNCDCSHHQHNNVDDDDSESSEQEDGSALLYDQIKKLHQL
jgi:hypothetical protein